MVSAVTSLKDVLTQSSNDIMAAFSLSPKFLCELQESSLNSAEQINILMGLSNGLKGSIVIGLTKECVIKIVSGMMGGMEVKEIDAMAKSALSEFATMTIGSAIAKLPTDIPIGVSPPTIATGENMFLMISRAPSRKVFFKLENDKFNIAYCIE